MHLGSDGGGDLGFSYKMNDLGSKALETNDENLQCRSFLDCYVEHAKLKEKFEPGMERMNEEKL